MENRSFPLPSGLSHTPRNSSMEQVGFTGNSRDQPPRSGSVNATAATLLLSPSNLLGQPQQLYSPTQAELESHHVVQHYFPKQDNIVPSPDAASAESHLRQDSAATVAMGETEIKEGDQGTSIASMRIARLYWHHPTRLRQHCTTCALEARHFTSHNNLLSHLEYGNGDHWSHCA